MRWKDLQKIKGSKCDILNQARKSFRKARIFDTIFFLQMVNNVKGVKIPIDNCPISSRKTSEYNIGLLTGIRFRQEWWTVPSTYSSIYYKPRSQDWSTVWYFVYSSWCQPSLIDIIGPSEAAVWFFSALTLDVRITDCTNHSSVLLWMDNVNDSHVFNLPSIYGHKYNSPFVWWLFEYRFPKRLIRFLLIASGYVFIWLSNSTRYIVCIYIGDTGWVLSYRTMLIHSCYRKSHAKTNNFF